MPKNEPWFEPRDEDAYDRMLDEKFGRGHPHPGGKPPNRSCALLLVAGVGGLAGAAVSLAAVVSRVV